jgi:hypothetical protein
MDLFLGIGGIVIAFLGLVLQALAIMITLRIIRPLPPSEQGRTRIGRLVNWLLLRGQWIVVGSPRAQGFKIGFVLGLGAAATVAGIIGAIIFLPSAICEDQPHVRILSPSDGDIVPLEIAVEGRARAREDGEFLYVFVRPLPNNPFQDYHAQAIPQQIDERRWDARPVNVGAPEDKPGTEFKICAVITMSKISPGERFPMLPAGPNDCVLVTRE